MKAVVFDGAPTWLPGRERAERPQKAAGSSSPARPLRRGGGEGSTGHPDGRRWIKA